MSGEMPDLVYYYDPDPDEPVFPEGATQGWVYLHNGRPGPAKAMPLVALTDADGETVFEPTGEWQDVTIVDDSQND